MTTRPSTRSPRSTRSTRGASVVTTKIHQQSTGVRPSTRVPSGEARRQSVRPSTRRLGGTIARESTNSIQSDETSDVRIKKSTRKPKESPSRAAVFADRREIKKYMAPIEFLAAALFVIIVSVFAFGLLQGTAKHADEQNYESYEKNSDSDRIIIYEERTSTNTGILRGQGQE